MALVRQREKSATKRLLNAERHALHSLKATVARHVDHAVAATATDERPEDARVRNAKAQIRWVLPAMLSSLTVAIAHARVVARAVALDDLSDHVDPAALSAEDASSDAPRAYAAAAGLTAAWGSLAMAALTSDRGRKSLASVIADTNKRMESRLRRTAATEVAHAFNEARSDAIVAHGEIVEARSDALAGNIIPIGSHRDAAERDAAPAPRPLKVWSAMLDSKVCPECASMHGTAVDARDEFPGGDPPRHFFCRCVPIMVESAESANDIRDIMANIWRSAP